MTTAICGMPAADICAWLKKMRPKWSLVRKDLVLVRQVGAAAVDEIDAGQGVGARYFLGAAGVS